MQSLHFFSLSLLVFFCFEYDFFCSITCACTIALIYFYFLCTWIVDFFFFCHLFLFWFLFLATWIKAANPFLDLNTTPFASFLMYHLTNVKLNKWVIVPSLCIHSQFLKLAIFQKEISPSLAFFFFCSSSGNNCQGRSDTWKGIAIYLEIFFFLYLSANAC